jgi:hypothetical protein
MNEFLNGKDRRRVGEASGKSLSTEIKEMTEEFLNTIKQCQNTLDNVTAQLDAKIERYKNPLTRVKIATVFLFAFVLGGLGSLIWLDGHKHKAVPFQNGEVGEVAMAPRAYAGDAVARVQDLVDENKRLSDENQRLKDQIAALFKATQPSDDLLPMGAESESKAVKATVEQSK